MKWFSIMILTGSLVPVGMAGGVEKDTGTEIVTYFGYDDCIVLKNDKVRVVLTEHGGRVLEYSFQGENAIFLDPSQQGWQYKPGEPTVELTGGRLDIGPENIIPPHPRLWFGPWKGQVTGPRTARLVSQPDEATGVQLTREFCLDEQSSQLSVTQYIRNVSEEEKNWCHWSRTFATGGGMVFVPLSRERRFPRGYIMYGPGSVMQFHPEDPAIGERDGFLEIKATPQYPKLGMDSYEGWFAYLGKNNLLWVKRYPVYPDRSYNEMAGLTLSIWYYRDEMCELEPIGPRESIDPGAEVSFTEQWWLLPHDYPRPGQSVDLDHLKALVIQETGPIR